MGEFPSVVPFIFHISDIGVFPALHRDRGVRKPARSSCVARQKLTKLFPVITKNAPQYTNYC